jgi:hypothetical protein
METEGQEVWIVATGSGDQWQLAGVYSSEQRAEAARGHLRDQDPALVTSLVRFMVDEDLTSWWPDRNVVDA